MTRASLESLPLGSRGWLLGPLCTVTVCVWLRTQMKIHSFSVVVHGTWIHKYNMLIFYIWCCISSYSIICISYLPLLPLFSFFFFLMIRRPPRSPLFPYTPLSR